MESAGSDLRSEAFVSRSVPENYDRLLAPVLFDPWAAVLVERVGVGAGQAVVDVASGTGVVARLAARRVGPAGRVVASDVSAAMLATAAGRPVQPGANTAPGVFMAVHVICGLEGEADTVMGAGGQPAVNVS